MHHITQGIRILSYLRANDITRGAWCLHPIVQADTALRDTIDSNILKRAVPNELILAMEYRRIANLYLSNTLYSKYLVHEIRQELEKFPEIKLMLIADKIQNRFAMRQMNKDLLPNHKDLEEYFSRWFVILDLNLKSTISKLENCINKE